MNHPSAPSRDLPPSSRPSDRERGGTGWWAAPARIDRWVLAPAAPQGLATFRVLCGSFAVVYLLVRLGAFSSLTRATPSRFEPVGPLALLESPLPAPVVAAALVTALVAGVAFTMGAWFRVSGPLFALLLLALSTYRSSWGQLLYFENLMVLHVLIVGFARSADAISFDAHRRPRRRDPGAYGWPLRLAACVTVITYLLAGVAKVRIGGSAWLDGDTLRNHVAYSAARLDVLGGWPSPLARPLMRQTWMFAPLAVATLAIELGAPLALLGGRWRLVWVGAAWLMHVAIAALMFVLFAYPLAFVAFVPLFPLTRREAAGGSQVPSPA